MRIRKTGILREVSQAFDALFVGKDDVAQAPHGLHEMAHTAGEPAQALTGPDLRGGNQLDGLREGRAARRVVPDVHRWSSGVRSRLILSPPTLKDPQDGC